MKSNREQSLILVGALGAPVGLKGEVRLNSFTQDPHTIAELGPLAAKDGRVFTIVSLRPQTNRLVARIEGITSRAAAEKLKGIALHVPRERLPATQENEFYFADLIGLSAVLLTGERLGGVVAVHNFGAGDLLEVRLEAEDRTVFIPFTDSIVPTIDVERRRVVIDPPEGLLDDAAKERPWPGEGN